MSKAQTSNQLEVRWWNGDLIGRLIQRGSIYFVYEETWIRDGQDLSPLKLPFNTTAFNGAKGLNGLPGLVADCLPDSWGLKVARKTFADNKWGEPNLMSLLAWKGTGGIGALSFLPPLDDKISRQLENVSIKALAKNASEIDRGEAKVVLPQLARGGTAGGAYPKSLVLYYSDGTLKAGKPDGVGKPCILKFDGSRENDSAATEHVYHSMASLAGINTATTRLISEGSESNRYHLLVERFDVNTAEPDKRYHFHSLSGILHKDAGSMDYVDLFRTIIQLKCHPMMIKECARRMLFNLYSSNHDDHGKNHAFIYDESNRQWSLTLAYDLTYSEGFLERGLPIQGEVWPSIKTLGNLCSEVGISSSLFSDMLEQIFTALDQWPQLAENAGVSANQIESITQRYHRIKQSTLS